MKVTLTAVERKIVDLGNQLFIEGFWNKASVPLPLGNQVLPWAAGLLFRRLNFFFVLN